MGREMRNRGAAGAVLLGILALGLVACSHLEITREYDATGITYEHASVTGLYDEAVAKFSMNRRDQTSATEFIEESAGAESQWTHESGRDVTIETLNTLVKLLEIYGTMRAPVPVPTVPIVPPAERGANP